MLPIKYDLSRIGTTPGPCSAGFLQHFHDWRRRRCGFPAILIRGITYKLQERAYGGLSAATARKLEQAIVDSWSRDAVKPAPPIALKPGTRLVREWGGVRR